MIELHSIAETHPELWLARTAYKKEYGNDPLSDAEIYATGWTPDGYHARRWWYHWPWKLTRPWLPRFGKGTDERCNPTVFVILPLLGGAVIRYKRGPLRTWRDGSCEECTADAGFPQCPLCKYLHWEPCVPVKVECGLCHKTFHAAGRWDLAVPAGGARQQVETARFVNLDNDKINNTICCPQCWDAFPDAA